MCGALVCKKLFEYNMFTCPDQAGRGESAGFLVTAKIDARFFGKDFLGVFDLPISFCGFQ
jgi:hypothetical protein